MDDALNNLSDVFVMLLSLTLGFQKLETHLVFWGVCIAVKLWLEYQYKEWRTLH